jgi:MutS domain V
VADPVQEYERRLADRRARSAALDRVNFIISNIRLAVAGVGAVLLWMAFVRGSISPWWPLGAWLSFGALAAFHAKRLQRFERAKAAERVYLRGLDRLSGRWAGTGRDGAAFLEGHPYARDLDLFGHASLFELLNTTRTEIGELTLADWLRAPAPLAEVRARQDAIAELRPLLDFKEDVAVLASESPVGRTGPLAAWSQSQPIGFPEALRVALAAGAIITIALTVAVYQDRLPPEPLFIWIVVSTGATAVWRKPFHHVLHAIETPERDLGLLAGLLARIESERFTSPRLAALHQALLTHGVPPSVRIARLRQLVSWLDSTHNMMFAPIAFVLLLRQQLAIAIDRWHTAYGAAVADWLRAVGDVESLGALATYAYERPGDPFPDLAATGPLYEAEGLAHPLIDAAIVVRNDVRLGGAWPHVIVVSGSNMSGKSTLLRSIGVSVVLGLAGGPVAARRVAMSALVLGATLHIEDSLQAGHSRFFAEILRLRTIADAARGSIPLLFLLDEILHGTNSHDRRIGAEGVVRALAGRGAIGLVTTHDLALTELPATLDSAVNMHFEDRLVDGKMIFDYRMRPGVVEHSNALALMRAIGLDV